MDYRQLRYFIAVAEELSFSRAARRLNISQPPLSIQIKAIETEVGTSLFSRNRRRVELTPAGEVLLENARRAVQQLEHTTEAVRRAGRAPGQPLGHAPGRCARRRDHLQSCR